MKLIKELSEGDRLSIQAIIGGVSRGTNMSGSPYLNIDLRDSSGQINAKKWEIESGDEEIFVPGNIVGVTIEVIKYRENLQAKILNASKIEAEEVDVSRFVKAPPIPKAELVARFNKMVDSVKDSDCQKLLKYFMEKYAGKVYDAPAAMSVHHEFSSGLIMHSLYIAEICDFLCTKYEDVNRDLLVTGAILHDFGKMIELEGPAIYHYSIEGKLIGHISIMCAEIREAANKLGLTSETPVLLEHMILSHHGHLEYGSPVLPLTKEALMLSIVDLLDSKVMIVSKALEEVKPGDFTSKIFHLDNCCFYKPKK